MIGKNSNNVYPEDDNPAPRHKIGIGASVTPMLILIALLGYNVYVYGGDALDGSNQFILLIGGLIAAIVGFINKVSYATIMIAVANNLKAITSPLILLLLTGALSGTWMISGVIPTMVYYGLQILSPSIFLVATVVICSIISVATGSSWTTSATLGIALMGIGSALGVPPGMTAGAVLSGAYFGDKLSPLSDTTNLAPAMAGAGLFEHIKYMALTTIPTILITIIVFIIIGLSITTEGVTDVAAILTTLSDTFHITGWLFLVPLVVVILIFKKTSPILALMAGILLGGIFALIFQPHIVANNGGFEDLSFIAGYKGIMNAITVDSTVITSNAVLNQLFSTSGMAGMLGTVWLIICAMVFGGAMDGIGALETISQYLLKLATSIFGLFASTVASCITLNATASDQYLALVIPGKMFSKAYKDKGLAPENLSRTLEDSGTVTSVLVPWNTCGAYQSNVLGVGVEQYFVYAIFNWLSPFMTLFFAAVQLKIKKLKSDEV